MLLTLLATALSIGSAAAAQTFEAASIRVSRSGPRRDNIRVSPGTVTMRNVSLRGCIGWAYHVMEYQVAGPGWLDSERFDIVAKAEGPAPEKDLRAMMQALLAERFQFESHPETKEMSAYVLSAAKGGPKVHESQTEGEVSVQPDPGRMTVTIQRGKISQVVELLSNFFHAPVIDETGLTGSYDLTVNVSKYIPQPGDGPPDLLSIISAGLRDEMGLKLDSRKTTVDIVVVDRAEKVPTEN